MFGKCALCGKEADLELSHIIPKMGVRKLKKTAAGMLRNTGNPNRVVQDSEKKYLLCGECEDLFSANETWFAKNIFHPYLDEKKELFVYNQKLTHFIVSVNWRSLYLDILDFVQNGTLWIAALERLVESEKIMRDYLLGRRKTLGYIENHILFFGDIEEMPDSMSDLRPHATFQRGISSYAVCYGEADTYFTLTNLMGIMLISFYRKGTGESWNGTQIADGQGSIESRGQRITSVIMNEFERMMIKGQEASQSLSSTQSDKVIERIKNKGKEWENTGSYQALKKDMELKNNSVPEVENH